MNRIASRLDSGMGCYLCAYLHSESPNQPRSLPASSQADADEPLATCSICSVWACSSHGSRYQGFECAICVPALAVIQAVLPGAGPIPATTKAQQAGSQLTERVQNRARAALQHILTDGRHTYDYSYGPPPFGANEPNLVTDLAAVVRQQVPEIDTQLRFDVGNYNFGLSIDEISATVRARFDGREFSSEVSEPAVVTVAGALLLAYRTADQRPQDRDQMAAEQALIEPPVAPWHVSHPALLDPIMWMVGTAYAIQ